MGKVIHFDISADDPERAMEFYSEVFGWEFKKMEMPESTEEQKEKMKKMFGELSEEDMNYWLITTGPDDKPGINGGLSKRRKPVGEGGYNAFISTIDVEDIDETTRKIEKNGGKIIMPKMGIPGIGWNVMFLDTEKNTVGILEADKSAEF
jgi:uncharacterized protein